MSVLVPFLCALMHKLQKNAWKWTKNCISTINLVPIDSKNWAKSIDANYFRPKCPRILKPACCDPQMIVTLKCQRTDFAPGTVNFFFLQYIFLLLRFTAMLGAVWVCSLKECEIYKWMLHSCALHAFLAFAYAPYWKSRFGKSMLNYTFIIHCNIINIISA